MWFNMRDVQGENLQTPDWYVRCYKKESWENESLPQWHSKTHSLLENAFHIAFETQKKMASGRAVLDKF